MEIDLNEKIIRATEPELFTQYLKAGWDDIMDFNQFMQMCREAGTTIIKDYDKKEKYNEMQSED